MKVNYLLIGAGRSGSTSFCKYLEQHPEVNFSTIKEVHYFSIEDLHARGEQYLHSFFKENSAPVIATADTYLMIDYKAIRRIHSYNPDMKIMVTLRDPLERAISSFKYGVNYGYQSPELSLTEAFKLEADIQSKETSIVKRNNELHFYSGLYHQHLEEWSKVFPRAQFFIARSKDLKDNPLNVVNQFAEFAGISQLHSLKSLELNQSATSKLKWLEQFLLNRESLPRRIIRNITPGFLKKAIIHSGAVDQIHAMNRSDKQVNKEMDLTISEEMKNYFKDDLEALHSTFGIDLRI